LPPEVAQERPRGR